MTCMKIHYNSQGRRQTQELPYQNQRITGLCFTGYVPRTCYYIPSIVTSHSLVRFTQILTAERPRQEAILNQHYSCFTHWL